MHIPTTLPGFSYSGDYETELRKDWGWIIRLKTSGRLIFTDRDRKIDVFLVGGGGGGGSSKIATDLGAGGGGGGYTAMKKGVKANRNEVFDIVIGAGGDGYLTDEETKRSRSGEATVAFGLTAEGGQGGGCVHAGRMFGGDGGSGGGGGSDNEIAGGFGGEDGGAGGAGGSQIAAASGGTGQGTTTSEFGMSGWKLYAGGGGGGGGGVPGVYGAYGPGGPGGEGGGGAGGDAYYVNNATWQGKSGMANTGGGGGGNGARPIKSETELAGGNGGSGVVCIRNNEDDVLPVVFNGTWLTQLIFNGTDVKSLIRDGTKVYMRKLAEGMEKREADLYGKRAGKERPVYGPG